MILLKLVLIASDLLTAQLDLSTFRALPHPSVVLYFVNVVSRNRVVGVGFTQVNCRIIIHVGGRREMCADIELLLFVAHHHEAALFCATRDNAIRAGENASFAR